MPGCGEVAMVSSWSSSLVHGLEAMAQARLYYRLVMQLAIHMSFRYASSFILIGINHLVARKLPRPISTSKLLMSTSRVKLEVEEKFALDTGSEVENRLMELGFRKKGEIKMCDWYFDLPAPILTPRDNWFRYREVESKGSSWELKRGRRHDQGGATVYEELEGEEAIDAVLSMLPKIDELRVDEVVSSEYDGHPVPQLPRPSNLVPFARIETHRSSWVCPTGSLTYEGLTVDLDGTQYGYMVGEVETVVHRDDEIPEARKRIRNLIDKLAPGQGASSKVPIGKLEHFMIRHRPDHYKSCLKGGSISSK